MHLYARRVLTVAFVVFSIACQAADVRATKVFCGPFDMHTSRGVSFSFECDDANAVQRRYIYFKSGDGYYMVPFSVAASGRSTVTVNRNDCVREEGKVAGWRNVEEIRVSFWHEDAKPLKWDAADMKLRSDPYVAVVSTAGPCVHNYPVSLEDCGLATLLVSADELDDAVLSSAKLLVPIWGKKKYPKEAMESLRRFEKRGGRVLLPKDRLAARQHRSLLELLSGRLPELGEVFTRRLAEADEQDRLDAAAAALFPAFMREGGDDEVRGVSCHTAYGPELVDGDPKWENWDRSCRLLKAAGFNCVNVNVSRGGIAFYESAFLPMSPEVKTKGDSVELIKRACEKYGMKFVAWKVCFRSRVGMKTPEFEKWIAEGRGAVSFDGKKSDEWLCPVRKENRKLEVDSLVELAKRRPWAISLDYIRYHGTDWCFCDTCRKAFEEYSGAKVANWPRDVRKVGSLAAKWDAFRRDAITSLVREVARRVRAEAPGVKIRADVFRRPYGDALTVAQEWAEWSREGIVDVMGPMDGGPARELKAKLDSQMPAAGGARKMMPTYYPSLWKRNTNAKDVMDVIRVGRESGVMGFSLFRFDGRLIHMLAIDKGEAE